MNVRTVLALALGLGAVWLVGCGADRIELPPAPPDAAPKEPPRADPIFEPGERYFLYEAKTSQGVAPIAVVRVHNRYVEDFIGRPGQGFGRMGPIFQDPPSLWVELVLESQGGRRPGAERAEDKPATYDAVTETLTLADGTGHSVRERAWQLKAVKLMSVNAEAGPVVYSESSPVGLGLPFTQFTSVHDQMKAKRPGTGTGATAAKRPLDAFETGALAKLRAGENAVLESSGPDMRVLGAIRARTECLSCHKVEVGTMLGAFTYTLKLRSEATPDADCLKDAAGLTDEELSAIRVIEARGGKVIRAPGGPVTELQLSFARRREIVGELARGTTRLEVHDSALLVLEAFPALRALDVSYSRISDAGLKEIAELKQLKKLDLTATAVTDEGVAALKKALPECEIVRVSNDPRP